MSLPQPERAARIAELALSSPAVQAFSWRSVSLLVDVAQGSTDLDPDQAKRFAELALEAAITSEILAGREDRP